LFFKPLNNIASGYKELFGDNIIPFNPNANTLKILMDRVFKKIPPFIKCGKSKRQRIERHNAVVIFDGIF